MPPKPAADGKPAAPAEAGAARPQQASAQQPPPSATTDFLRRDTDARWGVLPPKLQERLMNLHVDAIPDKYRDWLSAYVRELNRLDERGTGP